MRKNKLKPIIIFLSCICLISSCANRNGYDFLIILKNRTGHKITGLTISYEKTTKEISVPDIPPESTVKVKIKPTEDFGENSMYLNYKDNNGKIHREILLGYFEKGYKALIHVDISNMNIQGVIKMKVKADLNFY